MRFNRIRKDSRCAPLVGKNRKQTTNVSPLLWEIVLHTQTYRTVTYVT